MNDPQFNLIDDGWIPFAGGAGLRSLREVFSDLQLQRLSGNPVDKIAILRLLLCIVHASSKIPDEAAWRAMTPETIAKNALNYLETVHDRFDLYGARPFLQFPQLAERGAADPPASLQVQISVGNKVVFSGWNRDWKLSDPEKAILLLRSSGYACGGKKYDNEIVLTDGYAGKTKPNGKATTGKGGTLLGFRGYLHSYLLGETLLETLRCNLLTEAEIRDLRAFPAGIGTPFWEHMPSGEADSRARDYSRSYLGTLFPLDKFLLLQENGIIKTDGIPYPDYQNGLVDPALTIQPDGKKQKALWANTSKLPWRELPALLTFLTFAEGNAPPYFLSLGVKKLRAENEDGRIRLWTAGMQVSANSGEQYLSGRDDYVESEFVFALPYLTENSYRRYQEQMKLLEHKEKVLYACVCGYFKNMGKDKDVKDIAQKACGRYWEMTGKRAELIEQLAFSDATAEAEKQEQRIWETYVREIYDELCPHETPRQLMAWVAANPNFSISKTAKEKKKHGK